MSLSWAESPKRMSTTKMTASASATACWVWFSLALVMASAMRSTSAGPMADVLADARARERPPVLDVAVYGQPDEIDERFHARRLYDERFVPSESIGVES